VHKVLEALADELTVVNDLIRVMHEYLLGLNELVGVRVGQTGIVLIAACEQQADGGREGHRQHQVVSTIELRVGEDP
jgi:hypothetical protein